jgi:hypothetical protein
MERLDAWRNIFKNNPLGISKPQWVDNGMMFFVLPYLSFYLNVCTVSNMFCHNSLLPVLKVQASISLALRDTTLRALKRDVSSVA